VAPELFLTLQRCRERLLAGDRNFELIRQQALRRLRRAGFRPDYVEIRNAADLSAPSRVGSLRVLAAARLGRARLIDNVAVRLR
jgi:pantoate--beta-alanine ligase